MPISGVTPRASTLCGRARRVLALFANALAVQVILAPLAEEWTLRGAVQTALHRVDLLAQRSVLGIAFATLFASVLFASAHFLNALGGASWASVWFEVLTAFPFALIAGTVYRRTRNLWSAVFIHALGNIAGF